MLKLIADWRYKLAAPPMPDTFFNKHFSPGRRKAPLPQLPVKRCSIKETKPKGRSETLLRGLFSDAEATEHLLSGENFCTEVDTVSSLEDILPSLVMPIWFLIWWQVNDEHTRLGMFKPFLVARVFVNFSESYYQTIDVSLVMTKSLPVRVAGTGQSMWRKSLDKGGIKGQSAVGKICSNTQKKQLFSSGFTTFNALTSVIIKVREDALNPILTAG
ncbi:hypothetical protein EK904_010034 [Melospiza melodia maxima]|nr:hypothetical protein EK904_010034 [Melospiza melodia maxima]